MRREAVPVYCSTTPTSSTPARLSGWPGTSPTLLGGIVADPGRRVSQLPLLTEEERRQQGAWNQTEVVYDAPACLHEMVAAAVARVPDAVAVTCR